MAPLLSFRDICGGDPNCLSTDSPWYTYGRWIVLAICIGLAIIIFAVFSLIARRRRRRLGDNPLPLAAWAHRPPKSQWEQGYKNREQDYGVTQEQNLSQPEPAHIGQYAPPPGPPPQTKDTSAL